MLGLFKPILIPGVVGVACIAAAQYIVVEPLYESVLFGAGTAFVAIAVLVVTAMVTGWNVPNR
jgi:malic enzyme